MKHVHFGALLFSALFNLGLVYEESGQAQKAVEVYRQSLSVLEHILPVHILTADGA